MSDEIRGEKPSHNEKKLWVEGDLRVTEGAAASQEAVPPEVYLLLNESLCCVTGHTGFCISCLNSHGLLLCVHDFLNKHYLSLSLFLN